MLKASRIEYARRPEASFAPRPGLKSCADGLILSHHKALKAKA